MTNLGIPRSSIHGMRDFNIIAGFVCAGTGCWIHLRVCTGTGFRVSIGTAGCGIRDFAFCTAPRDNPGSRKIPREKSRRRSWLCQGELSKTQHVFLEVCAVVANSRTDKDPIRYNEDTPLVIRAIGVQYHTQFAKMSFDEIFDFTAGVYCIFIFYDNGATRQDQHMKNNQLDNQPLLV